MMKLLPEFKFKRRRIRNKTKAKIDSYVRGIYIHGTSDEATIGMPASHGCIRMINQDVIKLFDNVQIGTKVLIINN